MTRRPRTLPRGAALALAVLAVLAAAGCRLYLWAGDRTLELPPGPEPTPAPTPESRY